MIVTTAQRKFLQAFAVAILSLALGCSDGDSPVESDDPKASMIGTWSGTVTEVAAPGTSGPMTLTIEESSVAVLMSGNRFPSTLQSLYPDSVAFIISAIKTDYDCAAKRSGDSLDGTIDRAGVLTLTFSLTR